MADRPWPTYQRPSVTIVAYTFGHAGIILVHSEHALPCLRHLWLSGVFLITALTSALGLLFGAIASLIWLHGAARAIWQRDEELPVSSARFLQGDPRES